MVDSKFLREKLSCARVLAAALDAVAGEICDHVSENDPDAEIEDGSPLVASLAGLMPAVRSIQEMLDSAALLVA